tara:strand:- start:1873 stop:2598 length:726 start_codon:yes stop_codon:yes gene_type:complete
MPTPDLDLATHLDAELLGTLGTDIFRGPIREPSEYIPHRGIFCFTRSGPKPSPIFGEARTDIRRARVSVYIRGDIGRYSATASLARSVYDAVERARLVGYISVMADASEPLYIGLDPTEHPLFNLDVMMVYSSDGASNIISTFQDSIDVTTLMSPYTAKVTDKILSCKTATGDITIRLPAANFAGDGKMYIIKDEDGSAATNNITILPAAGDTIDGESELVVSNDDGSASIYSNGENFFIF